MSICVYIRVRMGAVGVYIWVPSVGIGAGNGCCGPCLSASASGHAYVLALGTCIVVCMQAYRLASGNVCQKYVLASIHLGCGDASTYSCMCPWHASVCVLVVWLCVPTGM